MAECRDAHEALEAIEKYQPDLLFLDIQMPEINGFELLEMLEKIPHVIFSTAYDQYALQAFEVNAVDYLLKPYVQDRFDLALERVKTNIQREQFDTDKIQNLLRNLQPEKKYMDRMLVKQSGKIIILNTDEIYWIEAVEDYVNLHTAKDSYLVLQSLSRMETKLNPDLFVRVHRSTIVNLEAVAELQPWSNGRLKCHMKDLTNQKKHNISFEEAQTVFYDDNARLIHDPEHSHDEDRYILLGLSNTFKILVVVHTYRAQDEVIRIISARKATKNEIKYYLEGD